jgi:hypothetical protein
MAAQFATQQGFDRHGILDAPRWAQAWVVLFFNQNFGIFSWLAIPAGVLLALKGSPNERRTARLFLLVAVVWFVMLSYVFTFLWIVPRYQILTACALAIPLSVWLMNGFRKRRAIISGGLLLSLVSVSVVCLAVADRNPLFGEKKLVDWVAKSSAPIVTDPSTLRGAGWLLDLQGASNQVVSRPPVVGDLYFFYDRPRRGLPIDWPIQKPGATWILVERFEQPPRPLASIISDLGAERFLPISIVRKLAPVPRWASVYKVAVP